MSKQALWIVTAAFLVSVAVRWPQLNRPLSAHHEFCTAFTLIALTNWYEDGFATHHGVPSGGFVREADAMMPSERFTRDQRAIGLYYFSHPPLAYELPYVVFAAIGVAPNVLGLQVFNLLFHLITAIALFFAVREILPGTVCTSAPLFTALLYLFMPAPLWFHGNVYMSDMFVQNFWVLHLVFAMRVFRVKGRIPPQSLVFFGVTLFLTVYTSWLGVFAAITAVLVALWRWWKERAPKWYGVVLVAIFAVVTALGLTAWRYLQVVDAQALLAHFGARFAVRGTFALPDGPWPLLRQLFINYRMGFLPVLLLLMVLAIARSRGKAALPDGAPGLVLFMALTGIPVLLDHALLLQYAEHDFAALKAGPFLCGSAGIGLASLPRRWAAGAVVGTCLAGVLYFYRINPLPGTDHGRYGVEMELGRAIAKGAAPDDVVFAIGLSTEPQVVWYAHRNVLGVASVKQAEQFLRDRGLTHGVVFRTIGDSLSTERIIP
ncbi:MAG: hypothetical protein JNL43_13720 [Flavobacteriales bacterium]|nr:hypothetical protein [Flavobacteriales bacterium]